MNLLLASAFLVGMLSTIGPCAFAMLPSYVAYGFRGSDIDLRTRLLHGFRSGIAVTGGFGSVVIVIALLLALGVNSVAGMLPWIALSTGAVLVVLGAAQILGRAIHVPVPAFIARRQPSGASAGTRGRSFAVFGVGYAFAALSCSSGLLITMISEALAAASVVGVLVLFGAYALGAATVLVTLSVLASAAGGVLAPFTRRLGRLSAGLSRLTGVVLVLAGAYIVLYWMPVTIGGGMDGSPVITEISRMASLTSRWLISHQTLVVLLAAGATAVALGVILATTKNTRAEHHGSADEQEPARQGRSSS